LKATWKRTVIAESDDTVVVEGNHYVPAETLRREFVAESEHRSFCPWKGTAHYCSLSVDGAENPNAVWYYPVPLPVAQPVAGRVAFLKGVSVAP
jgi:uncharacterized protein (DUF427 family)